MRRPARSARRRGRRPAVPPARRRGSRARRERRPRRGGARALPGRLGGRPESPRRGDRTRGGHGPGARPMTLRWLAAVLLPMLGLALASADDVPGLERVEKALAEARADLD